MSLNLGISAFGIVWYSYEVVLEKLEVKDLRVPILLLDLCVTLGKFLNPSELVVLNLYYHKGSFV